MSCVSNWEVLPARAAQYAAWPEGVPQRYRTPDERGITKPYTHQAEAINKALAREDVCVVTPTASGKTLCYNVPILSEILKNDDARALYIFPDQGALAGPGGGIV